MNRYLIILALFCIGKLATAENKQTALLSCNLDITKRESRAKELQELVTADQKDRQHWETQTAGQLLEVAQKDEARRKRVGEIFGEGCFLTAADYAAAAMVYQHGNHPDHYFQTFLWSKQSMELGDAKQSHLMALGIDRYLVSIGKKQLFGSQANRPGDANSACWCIQQVEKSFTDRLRKKYLDRTMAETYVWLKELNQGKKCPEKECSENLKPTPKGSVPGFW